MKYLRFVIPIYAAFIGVSAMAQTSTEVTAAQNAMFASMSTVTNTDIQQGTYVRDSLGRVTSYTLPGRVITYYYVGTNTQPSSMTFNNSVSMPIQASTTTYYTAQQVSTIAQATGITRSSSTQAVRKLNLLSGPSVNKPNEVPVDCGDDCGDGSGGGSSDGGGGGSSPPIGGGGGAPTGYDPDLQNTNFWNAYDSDNYGVSANSCGTACAASCNTVFQVLAATCIAVGGLIGKGNVEAGAGVIAVCVLASAGWYQYCNYTCKPC